MAVGRISVKIGSKGKASPHISYILREDKYKPHAKKVEELGKTYHGNMPQWAEKNPKLFWQEADKHERKNGSTYREHILTLPRELNEEQRIELVEEWIKNEIGDKHPYSYAMHNPKALDGKEQPHCHLMFCERELDGIERSPDQFFKRYNSKDPSKGGAKKANTGLDYSVRRQQLKEQRSRWEKTVNLHLERAGSKERVNLKNWKEKGLTEKPVNINMIEMSKLKKSQQVLKEAQFEVYKVLQTTPTVELNKQNRLAKERAENEQKTIHQPQEQKEKPKNDWIERAKQRKAEQKEQTPPAQPQEQPAEQKSRQGQWVRHRQELKKEQGEAVTTPPPPPQAQPLEQGKKPINPIFEKIKNMDKEQRQKMKENFEKALHVSPATLKSFSKEQLDTLREMQSEGKKFIETLQSVESHERLSERLEQMQQDREQGRGNDKGR